MPADDAATHDNTRPRRRRRHAAKWRSALDTFSPMWFAVCISSGGLGLVLAAPFPYPAPWLSVCSDVLLVIQLVLFAVFAALTAAKWAARPRAALRRLLADQAELAAHAVIPITLLTVAAGCARVSARAAYALWWAGAACVLAYCAVVLCVLASSPPRIMQPVLCMPVVGVATAAVEAAAIAASAPARLAVPMLVVAWLLLGIATWMAPVLYAIFLHRLMTCGWPDARAIAGLAILVGPAGQTSSAFQALGEQAGSAGRWAENAQGSFFTEQSGQVFQAAGNMMGLLFMGMSFLWFLIAAYAIVDVGFVRRKAGYSLSWWACVFPIVTLDTAMIKLASSMDSPAFRVLGAALFALLFLIYLVNWGFTIWSVCHGRLIFPPPRIEREKEKADDDRNRSGDSDETPV